MRFPLFFSALSCAMAAAVSTGCAPTPTEDAAGLTACREPRPQVCTMMYAPVCAQREGGELETQASACNACADDTVVGYVDGACPEASAP